MDPINPWLDREEVRRLAERLMISVEQPRLIRPDAGFDGAFVGYESAAAPADGTPAQPVSLSPTRESSPLPTVESVSQPVSPAPSTPFQPVPQPEPPAAPSVFTAPPFHEASIQNAPTIDVSSQFSAADLEPGPAQSNARGPFLERIIQFRFWLHERFSATGIFLLDREGSVIFDESGHGKLHFLARSLALASRRPGTPAGNVHVKVGSGATLEVIPVETPYGCLVLGAVVQESLLPGAIQEIMRALSEVASPPTV